MWLCRWVGVPYFYIINNDVARKAVKKKERSYTTEAGASPELDFNFFFIWQAIVRGQLFLQWTFFLLSPHKLGLYIINRYFLIIFFLITIRSSKSISCLNNPFLNFSRSYIYWYYCTGYLYICRLKLSIWPQTKLKVSCCKNPSGYVLPYCSGSVKIQR